MRRPIVYHLQPTPYNLQPRVNLQPTLYNLQPKRGFSILEIIITLGIFGVIIASAVPIYNKLHTSSGINAAEAQLIQTLRAARERSVAGLNNATHGVYVAAGQYTLYQDSTSPFAYAGRSAADTAYDQTTTLDSGLSLSPINTDVVFTKGAGTVAAAVTITLTQTGGNAKVINVNTFGKVE